jgi:hypothetical protein
MDEIYYDISLLGFEVTNMEHLQISDDGQQLSFFTPDSCSPEANGVSQVIVHLSDSS